MKRSFFRSKNFLAIFIATLVVGIAGGVYRAQQHWDHPGVQKRAWKMALTVNGKEREVAAACLCPAYLIQRQENPIALYIFLDAGQAGPAGAQRPTPPGLEMQSGKSLSPIVSSTVPEYLWWMLTVDGHSLKLNTDYDTVAFANTDSLSRGGIQNSALNFVLEPRRTPYFARLQLWGSNSNNKNYLGNEYGEMILAFESRPAFMTLAMPYIVAVLLFLLIVGICLFIDARIRHARQVREEKLEHAKTMAEQNPEYAHYTWQLARTRLEAYFDRNLFQVNLIFWLSVSVMIAGFVVVIWGIWSAQSASAKGLTSSPVLASAEGIITQFIGATFMMIYRSTMKQANDYILVLDRINNVGMAIQVLDRIPDSMTELKNQTRTRIVDRLLLVGRIPEPDSSNSSDSSASAS